jgi:hypothetical protein
MIARAKRQTKRRPGRRRRLRPQWPRARRFTITQYDAYDGWPDEATLVVDAGDGSVPVRNVVRVTYGD